MAAGCIIPVGGIGGMACRQNAAPILDGDAYHFGSEIGCQTQLIRNGGGPQIFGRHRLGICRSPDGLDTCILHTVYGTPQIALVPFVTHDAVDGGCRSGVYGSMACGGDGLCVRNESVLTGKSFTQHSFQSFFTISCVETVEVIPAHLVDHDAYHQFRSCRLFHHGLGLGIHHQRQCDDQTDKNPLHVPVFIYEQMYRN